MGGSQLSLTDVIAKLCRPGDVIATLNLGAAATLLLQPRYGQVVRSADATSPPGGMAPGSRPHREQQRVSLHLEHGDCYILSGDARWQWLHGISVPEHAAERRAVVWRFKWNG